MRVLILNQYFYPDHSATSQLMTDLAESLVERGVRVTALAGRGRYNGGETLAGEEEYQGVRIERAWATSFGKSHTAGRLFDYLSFYIGATWKLLTLPRHDIVMALTTPPLIGFVALVVARLRGMRLVALVQDVYPDVAVRLGALKENHPATNVFARISDFVLRGADRVIVLGECMRERMIEKIGAGANSKIDVIHNWADGRKIEPLGDVANPFVEEYGLAGKFVVLFSGNFGRVNEFATVLTAARSLRDRTSIVFLFIGEGAKRNEIEEFARANELENIRLLPYQPREMLRFSLAAGHASLVTLADGLAGLSVPSKTYGILAAGRPVLFVGDPASDIARLVTEHGCGAVVAAGDAEKLARVIAEWDADRERIAELGRRARQVFEERFDRAHAVDAYVRSFASCLSDDSPGDAANDPRADAAVSKETPVPRSYEEVGAKEGLIR